MSLKKGEEMNTCPMCHEIIWSGSLEIVYTDEFGRRYHAYCWEERQKIESKFVLDMIDFHADYPLEEERVVLEWLPAGWPLEKY